MTTPELKVLFADSKVSITYETDHEAPVNRKFYVRPCLSN